jgi:hypothetical protein
MFVRITAAGQQMLEEEGLEAADIADELAVVKVQIGYVNQLKGNVEVAQKIYTETIANKYES